MRDGPGQQGGGPEREEAGIRPVKVFLDGEFLSAQDARIPVWDRGFLLGDALFETLRIHEGRALQREAHLARLFRGAALLEIPLPLGRTALEAVIDRVIAENALTDGALRITLSRGVGEGFLPSGVPRPTLLVSARPLAPFHPALFRRIGATLLDSPLPPFGPLSGCKTTNRLPHLLGALTARKRRVAEAFFVGAGGTLLEGTVSNLFLVDAEGVVKTPPVTAGILPGTVRAAMITLCRALGIPLSETRIVREDLFHATEVFRTNALVIAEPVSTIDDVPVGRRGATTCLRLRAAYREAIADRR